MKTKSQPQPNLYDFSDYRDYLDHYFQRAGERGIRSSFAKALGCQLSYLTRILAKDAHLSPEQADAASSFFSHSHQEAKYFLSLVLYSRAGTQSLRNRLKQELEEMKISRLLLKNRIPLKQKLSPEDQVIYYSQWYFAVIHVGISIPEFQTVEKLALALNLPSQTVRKALQFLVRTGIANQKGTRFQVGETQIHLDQDSPLITKHHINFRIEGIKSLEKKSDRDLHYSSVISISRNDLPKVRDILIKAIEEVRLVVRESKEEKIACYCLDLFTFGNS